MRETKYWLWHLLSALVILILLGMHMSIMHLDGVLGLLSPDWTDPLAWENVLNRAKSGLSLLSYILLLAAALFHGLYGVNLILTEFWVGKRAEKLIGRCCWTSGILLFMIGAYTAIVFHFFAVNR